MQCLCCGPPRSIYMDSQSAQQVCDPCKEHHARNLQRNIDLHRTWWIEYTTEAVRRPNSLVSGLRAEVDAGKLNINARDTRIAELTSLISDDYANAPLGDLQTWMRSEIVRRAEARAMSAYRSRDKLMVALWNLDHLHSGGKAGVCKCVKAEGKCRDLAALATVQPALVSWETGEVERLKNGRDHGLPAEHPEVRKRARRPFTSVFRTSN